MDIDVISRLPFLPLLLAPHEVPRTVTALELPYRLLMSPIETARFLHRGLPFEHSGRTELWHTRMTTGKDDFGPDLPGKARALWSPDYSLGEITQQPDEEKGEGSDDQPVDMLTVLGPPP